MDVLIRELDLLDAADACDVAQYARIKLDLGDAISHVPSGHPADDLLVACDALDRFSLVRIIGHVKLRSGARRGVSGSRFGSGD